MMSRCLAILPESVITDAQRPLFFLLVGFIVAFALTRLSTRLARAGLFSRLRPGSIVTAGGLHIHHAVPGLGGMGIFGILGFALTPPSPWIEMLAFGFGSGAALTLDEFALILHLEDVYWAGEGRASIDAVVLGVTFMILLLTGLLPRGIHEVSDYTGFGRWAGIGLILIASAFVVVCYLKGKLFLGTIGIFVLPIAVIGAVRLAKAGSPWAHLRYHRKPTILAKARRRDEHFDRRWRRRKHFGWDLIGGKPHVHLPQLSVPNVNVDQAQSEGHSGMAPHGNVTPRHDSHRG